MSVRQDQVQVNVEINGAKAGESLKQIKSEVKQLTRELDQLPIGTDAWYKKLADIKRAKEPLDEARNAIRGVDTALKQSTESTGLFGTAMGKVGALFTAGGLLSLAQGAISGLKGFFSDALDEANEAEIATSRFKSTLDNLGKSDVFEKFIGLANDIANKIQYLDNDDITGVLEKLALYGKLTEDQVKELLPIIIDFAAKQRISIGDATQSIIGALEGQGKALKQYGINIKDAKTETERLDVILTTLKPKVEGAAEAFGVTMAGKTAIAEQNIKNLKEEIGTGLQPLIEKWYSFVAKVVSDLGNIFSSQDLGFFGKISALFGNQAAITTANLEKLKNLAADQKKAVAEVEVDPKAGNALFGSGGDLPPVKTAEELKLEEETRKKREEERKKQEQIREQAKKKQEQDATDRKARQEKLNEDLTQLEKDLAKSVVDAQREGIEKEVAIENLRYQNDLVNIKKRELALIAAGASREKIEEQVKTFNAATRTIHENNLDAIQEKFENARLAKAKQTQAEALQDKEDYYNNEVDAVHQYYDTLIAAIRAREAEKVSAAGSPEAILAIKQAAADAELAIEVQKNQDLKKINEENGKSTIANEILIAEASVEAAEKRAIGRKSIEEQIKLTIKDGLDFAIAALGQDEAARKKNAALIKGFSIAKITVNLAEEISGIFKNANQNAANMLIPGFGNIIGAVQAALAVGRATVAYSQVNRAQFASGGPTGKGSGTPDSSGHKIAGIVHADEWVSPKWMTEHPVYGRVIHQLEDARVRGFAEGGFTTTPTTGLPQMPMMINEDLLRRIAEAVENPARIRADVVYTDIERARNNVDDIRNNASIG